MARLPGLIARTLEHLERVDVHVDARLEVETVKLALLDHVRVTTGGQRWSPLVAR
jgi:hypothetical protein